MDDFSQEKSFSFSADRSKSVLFVKLSEDALLCLEEYAKEEAATSFKPVIQFKGDKGVVTIPGKNGKVSYDFSLSPMDSNGSQGGFQCMEKAKDGELLSLANIETKMQVHAKDTSIGHTKSKIEADDKKQKTYGAKEIKTAGSSQASSSQGQNNQAEASMPREKKKPVPLLKKLLSKNFLRGLKQSKSATPSGVNKATPALATHRTTVLLAEPLPPSSKEQKSKDFKKKQNIEISCDNYSDPRIKKQRISHCSEKDVVPTGQGISSVTVPNTSKPKNKSNFLEQNSVEFLLNAAEEQKVEKNKKKLPLEQKILPALTVNGNNITAQNRNLPKAVASKSVSKKQAKKKRRKKVRALAKKERFLAKKFAERGVPSLSIALQQSIPPASQTQDAKDTLTRSMANKDNDQHQILKKSVQPPLQSEKPAIEIKKPVEIQSCVIPMRSASTKCDESGLPDPVNQVNKKLNDSKLFVPLSQVDDIVSHDTESLQSKNNSFKAGTNVCKARKLSAEGSTVLGIPSPLNIKSAKVPSTNKLSRESNLSFDIPASKRIKKEAIVSFRDKSYDEIPTLNVLSPKTAEKESNGSRQLKDDSLPNGLNPNKVMNSVELPYMQKCENYISMDSCKEKQSLCSKNDLMDVNQTSVHSCCPDRCEVTSTTKISKIARSIAGSSSGSEDAAATCAFSAATTIPHNASAYGGELESIEEREECRIVYAKKLMEFNKLQTDVKMSSIYLKSLENTMTIHNEHDHVLHELQQKYFKSLESHKNWIVRRQYLSVQLGYLYNLMRRFDARLRSVLIK